MYTSLTVDIQDVVDSCVLGLLMLTMLCAQSMGRGVPSGLQSPNFGKGRGKILEGRIWSFSVSGLILGVTKEPESKTFWSVNWLI